MRKSYDTLSALVRDDLHCEVLSGDIFLFVDRCRRRAKALHFILVLPKLLLSTASDDNNCGCISYPLKVKR